MTYGQLAYLYDHFMRDAPYDEWIKITKDRIQGRSINEIVDLGCGTGEITLQFAKLGYSVTGVDFSSEMLAIAYEKSRRKNIQMDWVQQDIRNLQGFHDIDLITSYCDVINYVTDLKELEDVFGRVFSSLSPNGLFIFDIHCIYFVHDHLINHTFTDVSDEVAYIWECEAGRNEGEMYHFLTFFQKDQEQYRRFDEVHHERTFPVHVYEELLKKCGFSKIEFFSDFLPEKLFIEKESERIFIVAEK